MLKTASKIIAEGKMLPLDGVMGWQVQEKSDVRKNDRGIRNLADLVQPFIGKKIRITVELAEGDFTPIDLATDLDDEEKAAT